MSKKLALWLLTALLVALPTALSAETLQNGVDLWTTPADGRTFVDFAHDPLPAGFFCPGSEPFAGRVVFRGVPIDTRPRGAFGNADTIIQRLDDAVFVPQTGRRAARTLVRQGDGRVEPQSFQGHLVATTRVQVAALRFESLKPIRTNCGTFRVTAGLHGDQPITEMLVIRDDEQGGRFYAPLSLVTKLTFTPTDGGLAVDLVRGVDFPARSNAVWSFAPKDERPQVAGFVRVDVDGDRRPDVFLPGTSNFAAGWKNGEPRIGDDFAQASSGSEWYCEQPLDPTVPHSEEPDPNHCHNTQPGH
ncbi:MAG: hypothetical protein AAF481_02320 [Acidobacteriota bacterium]